MSNIQTGTYLGRFAVVHFVHVGLSLCHEVRRNAAHVVPTSTLEIHFTLVRVGLVVVESLACCVIHLVVQVGLD